MHTLNEFHDGKDVPCPGCGEPVEASIFITAAVDPADAALTATDVAGLAWFHTTTRATWPPPEAWGDDARALHVGTYEAAIETMFDRIRNRLDTPDAQFYLYRVALRGDAEVDPVVGKDAGNFATGFVALSSIVDDGFVVRRYLNAREHPGSISLALAPAAIAAVQRIAVPVAPAPEEHHDSAILAVAAHYADRATRTLSETRPTYVATEERSRVDEIALGTPGSAVLYIDGAMSSAALNAVEALAAASYLNGVGERVRDKFARAIATRDTSSTAVGRLGNYRENASVLVDYATVLEALNAQPWIVPTPS